MIRYYTFFLSHVFIVLNLFRNKLFLEGEKFLMSCLFTLYVLLRS